MAEEEKEADMNTKLNRLRSQQAALQTKMKRESYSLRRRRTRTLIQLGGLLHKAGLTEKFGIELGEDLQLEENSREKAMRLLMVLGSFER